jgi:hypothetical protein
MLHLLILSSQDSVQAEMLLTFMQKVWDGS